MPKKLTALCHLIIVPAIALLATSCKDEPGSSGRAEKLPPPGAANDGPVAVEYDYNELEYDDGLIMKDDAPFTGRAILHHSGGKTIKGRFNYVDGLYDGMIEEWYENGQRSALKHFKAGKQHGITNYWDENGVATKMVLYENDVELEVKTGDDIPKNRGL
jgi:hypothetical protein